MTSSRTSTVFSRMNPSRPAGKLVLTSKLSSAPKKQNTDNLVGELKFLEGIAKGTGEKSTKSTWTDRIAGDSPAGKDEKGSLVGPGKPTPISFKDIVRETAAADAQQNKRPLTGPASVHQPRAMGLVYGNRPAPANQSNYSTFASHERESDRAVHGRHEFSEGIIFSSISHEHDFNQEFDETNRNQSATGFGVVYSKYRKFIVLAHFATHVLALPIYTHEGRGLTYKKHNNEFVSVRDAHLKGTASEAESNHDVLWATTYSAFKNTTWHMMNDKTAVHFTKPYSHKYDTKCTITGELEVSSLVYLKKLFADALTSAVYADKIVGQLTKDFDGLNTHGSTASIRMRRVDNESRPIPFLPRAQLNEGGWKTVGSATSRRGRQDALH